MKFRSLIVILSISLALGACSLAEDITPPPDYQSPTPPPTLGPLFPANPPDLVAGAAIFVEKCAPCHGPGGLGDGPAAANLPNPPSALGKPEIAGVAVPAQWYTVVTQGNINSFMPPFDSLAEQDRWNVVAYALSLSTSPQQLAQGQALYQANCVACHGPDGKKSAKSDFTNQSLMARVSQNDLINFINSGTGTSAMPGFQSTLSQDQRTALAAYLRTFTLAPAQMVSASTPVPAATADGTTSTATPAGPSQTPDATQNASPSGTPGTIIGSISGKVSNGAAGALPAGLKVILHIFEHDPANNQFTEVANQEDLLAADGTYHFTNLSMPANRAFYASVDYAGTTYSSDPATPTAGQTAYDLPITIYDTTTDASGLVVDQVHILLDYSKAGVIQAVEYFVISNPGTKTIVAKDKGGAIVTVSLPKGYTNLQIQDGQIGDRYLQTADGFGDTSPVLPSKQQYQLIFAFDLPDTGNFEFTQPFSLNISAITFLVSEGVTASGQDLTDGGLKDMGNGGGKYQLYAAGARKTGESFTVTVSGKSAQASALSLPGGDLGRYLIIGLGTLGFLLILGAAWLYLRERRRVPAGGMAREEVEDPVSTDEVLDAIIALDDQHTAGNIAEEVYQQRRAELKAKLRDKI